MEPAEWERALTRAGRSLSTFCIRAGVFIAFICLLDAFASVALRIARAFVPVGIEDFYAGRAHADGYHHAAWPNAYYDELGTIRFDWHPYVYWLAAPHAGRYINIGRDGLRRTWRNQTATAKCRQPVRIFMFGGSTVFGEGVRDDYTVPSFLQRILDGTAYCCEVTNFGQIGYVSSQELLLLEEQLRKGNLPDLAVFYDGINDAAAALLANEPGVTYDESRREKEFNIENWFSPAAGRLYEAALLRFAMDSALGESAKIIFKAVIPGKFRLVKGQLVRRGLAPGKGLRSDSGFNSDVSELSTGVIRAYLRNLEMAKALAQRFEYQALFYWQPTVFQKNYRTAYENAAAKADHIYRPIIQAVYSKMVQVAPRNGIIDISGIFSNETQPYFVDEVHPNEEGNRLIARRMSRDILHWLAGRSGETLSKAASDTICLVPP
jgi:lysophospholipase L1-like esterase